MIAFLSSPRRHILLLVVASLGISSCSVVDDLAGPRTFYVSSQGDDQQRGTSPEAAWATLERASTEALLPGDTLILTGNDMLDGTLRIDDQDGGDPDQPVVVTADSGFPGITASGEAGIEIVDTSGVRIESLNIVVPELPDNDVPVTDGVRLYASPESGRHQSITIRDVEVHGANNGIAVSTATAGDGFETVRMEQVQVIGGYRNGILIHGPALPDYAHADIQILDSLVSGIRGVPGLEVNSGSGIAIGSVDGALVQDTESTGNGSLADAQEGPIGIWAYDSTRVTFRGNISHGNLTKQADGGGFGFDIGLTDSLMEGNLSYDNAGPGFLLFTHAGGATSSRNTVRYNATVGDATFSNYHGAISVLGGFSAEDESTRSEDLTVHHNTVVPFAASGAAALRLTGYLPGFSAHHNILGNIDSTGPIVWVTDLNTAAMPELSANLLASGVTGTQPLISWNGQDFNTLESAQNSVAGLNQNSVDEPAFLDRNDLPDGLTPRVALHLGGDFPADSEPTNADLVGTSVPTENSQVGAIIVTS